MNTKVIISAVILFIAIVIGGWWIYGQQDVYPGTTPNENEPDDTQEFTFGDAQIDAIDIAILESFPVQVRVTVTGNLPDGCTQVGKTNVERNKKTFTVSITTKRPRNAICTQALVPFEEGVSLPVEGLSKGTYTVDVNGVTDTFTLEFDNTFPNKG